MDINNKKNKRKYFRYNNILLILFLYYISFSLSSKNNKLIHDSEIIITISGNGKQQILRNEAQVYNDILEKTVKLVFGIKPSEILDNKKK